MRCGRRYPGTGAHSDPEEKLADGDRGDRPDPVTRVMEVSGTTCALACGAVRLARRLGSQGFIGEAPMTTADLRLVEPTARRGGRAPRDRPNNRSIRNVGITCQLLPAHTRPRAGSGTPKGEDRISQAAGGAAVWRMSSAEAAKTASSAIFVAWSPMRSMLRATRTRSR
jgi:hypothetical protein